VTGSDGLRLKDLPELSLYPEPKFLTTPARVVVRPSLSKVDHQYFSFLNNYARLDEATSYSRDHLMK